MGYRVTVIAVLLLLSLPASAQAGVKPPASPTPRPPTNTPYPTRTRQPTYTPLPTATRRHYPTPIPGVTRQGVVMTMTPRPRSATDTGPGYQPDQPQKVGLVMTMTPKPGQPARVPGPAAMSVSLPSGLGRVGVGVAGLVMAVGGVMAWRQGWWRLALAWLVAWRDYQDSEQKERRQELKELAAQRKKEKKQLTTLAKALAQDVVNIMTQTGYCYKYKNPAGGQAIQKVTFTHAFVVAQEQVLLRLGRVPHSKNRFQLFSKGPGHTVTQEQIENGKPVTSWVATELLLALGRQVQLVYYEDQGIFFQIDLKQGVSGVPRLVLWRDPDKREFSMMDGDPLEGGLHAMPDVDKYPGTKLYIPVGLGRNRKVIRKDLRRLPHLIVSGATGTGKSNFLDQMICTFIERNTPETLRLYLIDLKVVGFTPYQRIAGPDSIVSAVATSKSQAVEVLETLADEIEQRQVMLKGVARDIEGWNHQRPNLALPYHVVVFDELSLIMLSDDKALSKAGKRLIQNYLAIGRAFGGHMILCTQAISSKVVDLLVTANTPGKIIFRQATRTASMNAIGDSRAWTSITQPGMAFFCDERGNEDIVQSALFIEHQREDVLDAYLARQADAPKALTIEEIGRYALENYGGRMQYKEIWRGLSGRGTTKLALESMIRHASTYPLELYGDGVKYQITIGRGNKPTTIAKVSAPDYGPENQQNDTQHTDPKPTENLDQQEKEE